MRLKDLYILLILFLLISSCEDELNPLINCQDPSNDCFIEQLENVNIQSFSPNEIIINFDNQISESLYIDKIDNEIESSIILYPNIYNEFIDTNNIQIDHEYHYTIRNNNWDKN